MSLGRLSVAAQPATGPASAAAAARPPAPLPAPGGARLSDVVSPATGSDARRPGAEAASCVTRWTSMSPDSRVTRAPIPSPARNDSHRPRLLAPSTICVAFSRPREVEQGDRDVVTHDLVPGAAHRLGQAALPPDLGRVDAGQPVAPARRGRPAGPSRSSGRRSGRRGVAASRPRGRRERDDDPLAGLPRLVDPVRGAVALQPLVHPFGHPQQRQLAQRGEVADPEVVGQGGVHALRRGRCCRGPSGAAAPRARCRRSRSGRPGGPPRRGSSRAAATPLIRSTTSLSDSRCWMLTVVITSMPASRSSSTSCHRFSFRLPGMLLWASSSTRATAGRRASTRVEVELLERRTAVLEPLARHDLEPLELLGGVRAAVRLDDADDDVGARDSSRRRPSSSMANVLPTPGAMPR